MKLVIVESPNKVKKISALLGPGYEVVPTLGHFTDLPDREMGVSFQDWEEQYRITKPRVKSQILAKAAHAQEILIATDPDREGEGIAWHVARLIRKKTIRRVRFSAITHDALQMALTQAGPLDTHLIEAQRTRRVVDRLFGYSASPLVRKNLDPMPGVTWACGRVQTACLRLVVERERQILAFQSTPYWVPYIEVETSNGRFKAKAEKLTDPGLRDAWVFPEVGEALTITRVQTQEKSIKPPPPFITASLQKEASKKFGWSVEEVMRQAQTLFEKGLITYHRTDACVVAPEGQALAEKWLNLQDSKLFTPHLYQAGKKAQEGHEAIRPTGEPESLPDGQEKKLYHLIKTRFLMAFSRAGRDAQTKISIGAYQATGTQILDPGWRVFQDKTIQEEPTLPVVWMGETVQVLDTYMEAKQTEPPKRFTEAGLVEALEKAGIGRPSTYAAMVQKIQSYRYVEKNKQNLLPTLAGFQIMDFLLAQIPEQIALDATARLEALLDDIASGSSQRKQVIEQFWTQLPEILKSLPTDARPAQEGPICPKCGKGILLARKGKYGPFQSCNRFREGCTYSESLPLDSVVEPAQKLKDGAQCPTCGKPMRHFQRKDKTGYFWVCKAHDKPMFFSAQANGEFID